eukprot:TRINITY_DN11964_c0_g1_i2.p1 TRINITY_DN11964_c0_g1~~TRINITY_DN11964_c0_g1_i2.p1  ORF type:complete len:552 (+),score=117.15 TRINITY_DN11964_c0_g1_i2:246-1901(+)
MRPPTNPESQAQTAATDGGQFQASAVDATAVTAAQTQVTATASAPSRQEVVPPPTPSFAPPRRRHSSLGGALMLARSRAPAEAAAGTSETPAPAESPALASAASASSSARDVDVTRALGSWRRGDLERLPRFPHRDSFPIAKDLVRCFLNGELNFFDLRISLFWLGFGLTEVPVVGEPLLNIVPLCKDLDTYADTANELGYDPVASVHGQPVVRFLVDEGDYGVGSVVTCGKQSGSGSSRSGGAAGGASSSSSSGGGLATEHSIARGSSALLAAAPCPMPSAREPSESARAARRGEAPGASDAVLPSLPFRPAARAKRDALQKARSDSDGAAGTASQGENADPESAAIAALAVAFAEEDADERGNSLLAAYFAADPLVDGQSANGASSSQQANLSGAGAGEVSQDHDMTIVEQVKVKLLHAGGWSDSSSASASDGSEGRRTPPTPPASSSANASRPNGRAAAQQRADTAYSGLDADHVEQFTVSFVADLQMQEDLEEVSCLCTFCLDEMDIGQELCRLPCMHTFHRRCVHAWLARDRRCMLCRLDITRPRG